ncbi:hypothetical protein [Stenomitos frigidus]|nr:hypothetical protein [Stenomitos frigidus]
MRLANDTAQGNCPVIAGFPDGATPALSYLQDQQQQQSIQNPIG